MFMVGDLFVERKFCVVGIWLIRRGDEVREVVRVYVL